MMTFDTAMLNTITDLLGGMLTAIGSIAGGWAGVAFAMNFFGERDGAAMKQALTWGAGAGILAAAGIYFMSLY